MAIERTDNIKFFNYGKAFIITCGSNKNNPRFLIEAKCTIVDGRKREDYYLCAPCKGEHTFAKNNLFEEKAFEFTPVFGRKEVLIFRKFGFFNGNEKNEYKKAYTGKTMWGDKKIKGNSVIGKELNTSKKIISAVKKGTPIMCRFIYRGISKYAIIDFPVKTINAHKDKWQVDTGLMLFPNLKEKYSPQIFRFDLAYVAFNSFKLVEVLGRDFFQITKDYWLVHPCKILKIDNPDIKLYSL